MAWRDEVAKSSKRDAGVRDSKTAPFALTVGSDIK